VDHMSEKHVRRDVEAFLVMVLCACTFHGPIGEKSFGDVHMFVEGSGLHP
jgi:hypothetical protein